MIHTMKCEVRKDRWVWRCSCGFTVWIMKEDNEVIIVQEGDDKADHTGFAIQPEDEQK